jgi:hypothetical protein
MYQRLVLTIATASGLIGLYATYQLAMRSFVATPNQIKTPVTTASRNDDEAPDENRRVAIKYLPEWAAKSDIVLHADHAFIYTNQWKRVENNAKQVQFTPFAMAWLLNDSDGKENAVTIACESATLEFESEIKLDEKIVTPGRVIKASFDDDVQIAGPNGLNLKGQNFIFNESTLSLVSSYPIQFQYLKHGGMATQIKMRLIPSPAIPGSDRPRIYGVEEVKLIGGTNRIDPDKPGVKLFSRVLRGQDLSIVTLQCHGDLTFNVVRNIAVLENDVRAIIWKDGDARKSPRGKRKYTEMDCSKLTVQLKPKDPVSSDPNANSPTSASQVAPVGKEFQSFNGDLELSWLMAESLVKTDRIKIKSDEYGFKATMSNLTYKPLERRIWMNSDHPKHKDVHIERQGSSLEGPMIDVFYNLDNSLKALICYGGGRLKSVDKDTNKIDLQASWHSGFSLTKDDATNLHHIKLIEKAQFHQPSQATKLGADSITVTLAKINIKIGEASGSPAGSEQTKNPVPEPKSLLADGNAWLLSPQMVIERTNTLDIQFEEGVEQATAAKAKSRTRLKPAGLSLTSDTPAKGIPGPVVSTRPKNGLTNGQRQIGFANVPAEKDRSLDPSVQIPLEDESPASKSTSAPPKAPQQPIHVLANRIVSVMHRNIHNGKVEPRDVHAEGKVRMTQEGEHGEKALSLSGETVDMHAESEDKTVVHVLGSPAIIQDQSFNLEGKNINLDRGTNRAWVDGPGTMRLPIPKDANVPGLEDAADRNLYVHWNEKMDFDGLQAKFFGRVESRMGLAKVKCEQMTVQLENRLSFEKQSTGDDSKPTPKTVRCEGNVSFENSSRKGNDLISIYRGTVGELLVNYQTGLVEAEGPGKVQIWQRKTNTDGDRTATLDTIQANRPIPTELATWDFTRIEFEGKLKGEFDGANSPKKASQLITVRDRVEVIHGPVNYANIEVNPDKLPSMGGTMRCDRLQMVNHPASERVLEPYYELVGFGNAEIEGKVNAEQFTASADRISYDGSKGLFILKANGTRMARINGMVNLNSKGIKFIPKLKKYELEGAAEGSLSR